MPKIKFIVPTNLSDPTSNCLILSSDLLFESANNELIKQNRTITVDSENN